MKIIKNVLNKKDLEVLNKEFTNPFFPWYFNNFTADGYENFKVKGSYEAPQLTHNFIKDGKVFSPTMLQQVGPMLDNIYKDIDIQKILRMKLNLQFPHNFQKNEIFNTPHYDDANTSDLKIMIFYLNTCDAHTYFFRGKKVHKKVKVEENTLVCFDGTTLHAGSNPKKTQYKLCLNINYI
jgi:hypothetical protein|tara:strand:- start:5223 stop:5762 length:540 start_codon:yes stop_codon:yes gene_type:complete